MKKILVADASPAVRETIHLILGGSFAVVQKPALDPADSRDPSVDLLILGVSSAPDEPTDLSDIIRRFSCPVLFLVDAEFRVASAPRRSDVDYLVKPFNPYSLRQKVTGVIGAHAADAAGTPMPRAARFLEPPFLPAQLALLARRFAESPFPVLLVAEPGCGQEEVARAMHALAKTPAEWLSVHPGDIARLLDRLRPTRGPEPPLTVYFHGIDAIDFSAQSALLDALLEEHTQIRQLRLISNSRSDLLEKVYRGEFLDALYYRLAMLVLTLPPLRDRIADIAAIAERLAEECAERLGIDKVRFAPAALERMRNYLWFGNLDEIESVVSRTITAERKQLIDAPDLIFGESRPVVRQVKSAGRSEAPARNASAPAASSQAESGPPARSVWNNGHSQELKLLISELAHEFKNPMVTVKTFSQLLGDRFDDPAFRVRFQQTVNGDIQRMDDLLEALISFSHFGKPDKERVLVYEQLRRVEEELLPDCIKKETILQWTKRGESAAVHVDKAQFVFAFKNILKSAVAQVKPKSEIQVEIEDNGSVGINYPRDAAAMTAMAEYVGVTPVAASDEALPLRLMLANILLERNGGAIRVEGGEGQTVRISTDLPAENPKGDEAKP